MATFHIQITEDTPAAITATTPTGPITLNVGPQPLELGGVSLIGPAGPPGADGKDGATTGSGGESGGGVLTVNGLTPDAAGNVQTHEVHLSRAAFDLIATPDPRIVYYLTD